MRRAVFALLIVLALLVSARQVSAQVTFDAFANSFCDGSGTVCTGAGATTLTYALTVGAGSNRALAVVLTVGCAGAETAPAISTVKFDPTGTNQSLTQIETVSPASSRRGELWALPAGTQPTSGTHNIEIIMASGLDACAGSSRLSSGAFAVAGVDQTTTFTDTNINSGSGTSATLTLTGSGANDLGFHGVCAGNGLTSTTETSRWSVSDTNTSCNSSGGATAAGSDTSFSWSIPSDSWIMVGGAFKASTGGAAPVPKLMLLGVGGDWEW